MQHKLPMNAFEQGQKARHDAQPQTVNPYSVFGDSGNWKWWLEGWNADGWENVVIESAANDKPRYLGDGVYASFDGYQIWLAANHHTNRVIALESTVFAALVEYENDLRKGTEMKVKMPPAGHVVEQFFDVKHIKEIFSSERIASIPTRTAALSDATGALNGNKAVSSIYMVVAVESDRFALYRFRRENGIVIGREVWDFGKGE